MADVRAEDFLYDMQHAGRNSVDASHRDHLRMDYEYGTNDPSFTATATSIRLKWRRDSAKRDAKQVYTAPVANLSDRNCERNDIVSIYERPNEIDSDKSFRSSNVIYSFTFRY